ncbi:MAG: ornithine carbamoyltransferase [Candidatus Symbiobacter sp.]|nr:ornithine carbamoyltransferase [Candidatus Symbiobacter sp.]
MPSEKTEKTTSRHFLEISHLSPDQLRGILASSLADKQKTASLPPSQRKAAYFDQSRPMRGRTLAMIFERKSTRTRISFDLAMRQLGGEVIVLNAEEIQLARDETLADTARVMSRYVDAIMIRAANESTLLELAQNAAIPVINGLTNKSHPCQVMADLLTFEEKRGPIKGHKLAWVGDANNVCASWIHAAILLGAELHVATPPEFAPSANLVAWARDKEAELAAAGGRLILSNHATGAVERAKLIITDTFVSMGDEGDAARRLKLLAPFQVTTALLAHAAKDALFMHCLPAHRGEEVTSDVIDGPLSVVWDEAENRTHAQRNILRWCLEG